jgi:hypothetical protein
MCNALIRKNWLYVAKHGLGLAWETLHRGLNVCLYAQMLGLDSRVAKCAVDLIPYKTDPAQI